MEFSERLRALRQEKGLSQAALAQTIHISRSAVAKWENGLGLPGEESLILLADYFGITAEELLGDVDTARILVEKNRTIESQGNLIAGLAIGAGVGLFLMAFVCIPPLRDMLTPIALGVVCMVLGAFNLKGNIASIHWYNRRKVSKEDQLPYCRLVGWGTVSIGATILLAAVVQTVLAACGQVALGELLGGLIVLGGVLLGLTLILVAQFRYNRGIF